jgi:hypothetical protein
MCGYNPVKIYRNAIAIFLRLKSHLHNIFFRRRATDEKIYYAQKRNFINELKDRRH